MCVPKPVPALLKHSRSHASSAALSPTPSQFQVCVRISSPRSVPCVRMACVSPHVYPLRMPVHILRIAQPKYRFASMNLSTHMTARCLNSWPLGQSQASWRPELRATSTLDNQDPRQRWQVCLLNDLVDVRLLCNLFLFLFPKRLTSELVPVRLQTLSDVMRNSCAAQFVQNDTKTGARKCTGCLHHFCEKRWH